MQQNSTLGVIQDYFKKLPEAAFPDDLKANASVVLSGSTGWGISEGFDEKADWDLHILLENEEYQSLISRFDQNYVIDDQEHAPIVFGQIRSRSWLSERLNGQRPGSWPLYLWIYTRCQFVQDPMDIKSLVAQYQTRFEQDLNQLRCEHFVLFSVRRFDMNSSVERSIMTAMGINRGEMIKAALQTFSLIHGEPYPYNKWLAKHVEQLDPSGIEFVELCNRCLMETDIGTITDHAKILRDELRAAMIKAVGEQRWITHWWEFNKN